VLRWTYIALSKMAKVVSKNSFPDVLFVVPGVCAVNGNALF
jgi:hypothetical protein